MLDETEEHEYGADELFELVELLSPEQRDRFTRFDDPPRQVTRARTGMSNSSVPLPRVR